MGDGGNRFGDGYQYSAQTPAARLGKFDVNGTQLVEKRILPPECFVDELIDEDKVAGFDFFAQGTDRPAGDKRGDA